MEIWKERRSGDRLFYCQNKDKINRICFNYSVFVLQ